MGTAGFRRTVKQRSTLSPQLNDKLSDTSHKVVSLFHMVPDVLRGLSLPREVRDSPALDALDIGRQITQLEGSLGLGLRKWN